MSLCRVDCLPFALSVRRRHFGVAIKSECYYISRESLDDAKCIVVTRFRVSVCVSVCLSAAACPHYCTDPDVTWEVVGDAPSCAQLGGFAIGARIALLWQHNEIAKC